MRNYSIFTGYWSNDQKRADFFNKWLKYNYNCIAPSNDLFVINSKSEILPEKKYGKWIDLSFNMGHVHDLDINTYTPKKFCGWSGAFMMGAMISYFNNTDYLFIEQDCLTFGDIVGQLYKECEDKKVLMLLGRQEDSDNQGVEQSLMLLKHELILPFIQVYISLDRNDAGPNYVRPERKFLFMKDKIFFKEIGFMSFGYGRGRPDNLKEEISNGNPFYIQHITDEEMGVIENAYVC